MRSFQIVALVLMFLFLMAMPAFSDNSSATPGVTLTVGSPILFQSDNLSAPEWRIFYDVDNPYGAEINLTFIDMSEVGKIVITMAWLDDTDTCWGMIAKPAWYSIAADYGDAEIEIDYTNYISTDDWLNTTHIMFDSSGTGTLLGASVTVYGEMAYSSIEDCLLNANDGDTIIVLPDIYVESFSADVDVDIIGIGAELWFAAGTLNVNSIQFDSMTMFGASILNASTVAIGIINVGNTTQINADLINATTIYMMDSSRIVADTINASLIRTQNNANVTANETFTTDLVMLDTSTLTTQNLTASTTDISEGATLTILYIPEPPPYVPNLSIFAVLIGLFVIVGIVITVLGSELEMETVSGLLGGILVLAVVTILIVFL